MNLTRILSLGMIAAFCFTACAKSGNSSSSESSASATAAATTAATPASAGQTAASGGTVSAAAGSKVYTANCSSCHQSTGQGVAGSFPPLAGNPVVTGDASKVVHIVKYGLSGSITVDGKPYNGMMPAWASQLSNSDIASVVTYIRSSWGNKASAVTEADVSAVAQ